MFGRLPKGWAVTKLRDILKAAPDYGANSSATDYDPSKTYREVEKVEKSNEKRRA